MRDHSFFISQGGGGGGGGGGLVGFEGGMKKIGFYREGGVSDDFIQMQTACQNAEKQVFLTFRKLRFFWGSMPQDPTLLCTKRQFYHTVQYKKIIKAYMYQTERFIRKE